MSTRYPLFWNDVVPYHARDDDFPLGFGWLVHTGAGQGWGLEGVVGAVYTRGSGKECEFMGRVVGSRATRTRDGVYVWR